MMPLRVRTLALVGGAGSGAYIAATSIVLTSTFGVTTAASALAAGSFGRLAALSWIRRLTRSEASAVRVRSTYVAATTLMVGGASAGLAAAEVGLPLLVAALGVFSGAGGNLTSTLAATARKGQMVAFYPLLMIGGAAGATLASWVVVSGAPMALVYAVIVAPVVEPLLIRPYLTSFAPAAEAGAGVWSSALPAAALAALSYGPLTAYAALVTASVGAQWVGPAMGAYAVGAACAAAADRALRARSGVYRDGGWVVTVTLAAAGVLTWALVPAGPAGMLVGRAAAGVLMFLAQGRLLQAAFEGGPGGPVRVASASAGLGFGTGVGGLLAAALAGAFGVVTMALTLSSATLLLASRRRTTS